LETQLSLPQPSGSESKSLITTKCSTDVETVGLKIDEDLTYEEWEDIGFELARVGKGYQWWVGDWINFGEKKYGETYEAAIEATGLKKDSCRRIGQVCREFESGRRRPLLSFKHHAEVQGLDEAQQDELLEEAERECLSCAKVREKVQAIKGTSNAISVTTKNEDDFDIVEAFERSPNRIAVLKSLVEVFTETERELLKEFLNA
jgi:hypothetical protein